MNEHLGKVARRLRDRIRRALVWPPRPIARIAPVGRRTPVSRDWGARRGAAIDRFYIERFLARFGTAAGYAAGDIRGEVLDFFDRAYTDIYGLSPAEARRLGLNPAQVAVARVDIVHADDSNPAA